MNVQIIEKDGRPEWVVIPYEIYEQMLDDLEMQEDVRDLDEALAALAEGRGETYPGEIVNALLTGVNPIRVFREHRSLTQQDLAAAAGISVPYLSQLEGGKRRGTMKVLSALAKALNVDVELLYEAPK